MEIHYLNEACEKIAKASDLEFGKGLTPLSAQNNLLFKNKELNKSGYGVFTLKSMSTFEKLEQLITQHVKQELAKHQPVPHNFQLSQYHNYLLNDDTHYKVSTWALEYTVLGDVFDIVKTQVEELLQQKLKLKKILHMDKEGEYLGFRLIRPGKADHNPFHRDSWISYWQNTVNIWMPVCGFENANSLQLIPASHLWPDEEILKTKAGAEINGKKYHVSAAIGTTNSFAIVTPDLSKGQAILFSPYLLHGNGINKRNDTTRVSVEFRFGPAD